MKTTISTAHVRDLFRISLLYANPLVTAQIRKKKAALYALKPDRIYRDLLVSGNLWTIGLMTLIYGVLFMPIRFDLLPSYLDYMLVFLVAFSFIQGFTFFYNLFYESRDTYAYMALPVRAQEVFIARSMMAALAVLQLLAPTFVLFMFFFRHNGVGWIMAFCLGAVYMVVLVGIVLAANFALMQLMARFSLLGRFKNSLLTGLMLVSQIGAMVFILVISRLSQQNVASALSGQKPIPGPLSGLLLSASGRWLVLAGALLLLAVLGLWVYRRVACRFYDFIYSLADQGQPRKQATAVKRQRVKTTGSRNRLLLRYNRSLLNNSTIISSSIISPALMPAIVVMPMLLNNDIHELRAMLEMPGMAPLAAVLCGIGMGIFVNAMPSALPAVIVSLDGPNFDYIKALPISMRDYFLYKWRFSAVVSGAIPFLVLTGLTLFLGLRAWVFAAVAAFVVVHSIYSVYWLRFDLHHLVTDWRSEMDLYNRSNKGLMMASFFGAMIAVMAIAGGAWALAYFTTPWIALAAVGVVYATACIAGAYAARQFFDRI